MSVRRRAWKNITKLKSTVAAPFPAVASNQQQNPKILSAWLLLLLILSIMARKVTTTGNHVHKESVAAICRDDQSTKQFKPGDVAWIKTRDSFWWPAQVVDERSVSSRPKRKVKDGVLVRIYGSYEYLYVDLVKCSAEFEKLLEQDNLSAKEAFEKAMNADLSRLRSGGKSKRKVSESTESEGSSKRLKPKSSREPKTRKVSEKSQSNTPKGKIRKKQNAGEPPKTSSPCTAKNGTLEEPSSNLSERRTRVMQSLGLIAPVGSPYRPNGNAITSSPK